MSRRYVAMILFDVAEDAGNPVEHPSAWEWGTLLDTPVIDARVIHHANIDTDGPGDGAAILNNGSEDNIEGMYRGAGL